MEGGPSGWLASQVVVGPLPVGGGAGRDRHCTLFGEQALWDLGGIGAFGASAGVLDQPSEVTLLSAVRRDLGETSSSVLFQHVRHSGPNDGNFPRAALHD